MYHQVRTLYRDSLTCSTTHHSIHSVRHIVSKFPFRHKVSKCPFLTHITIIHTTHTHTQNDNFYFLCSSVHEGEYCGDHCCSDCSNLGPRLLLCQHLCALFTHTQTYFFTNLYSIMCVYIYVCMSPFVRDLCIRYVYYTKIEFCDGILFRG